MFSISLAKLKLPYLLSKIAFLWLLVFCCLPVKATTKGTPIEIESDKGLICDRKSNVCTATGNVRTRKDGWLMLSNKLTAYMRRGADNKQEIWQIHAAGSVRFFGAIGETGFAPQVTYNVDSRTITLTGPTEYPVLIKTDRLIKAKTIIVFLNPPTNKEEKIDHIEAHDDVFLSSPVESAHADFCTYIPRTKFATLIGNVRVNRAEGQIKGPYAEVNLDTGVSKMLVIDHSQDDPERVQAFIRGDVQAKTLRHGKSKLVNGNTKDT